MPSDHPGFDYWKVNDPGFPFPVGDITVDTGLPDHATAHAEFDFPPAIPNPSTVAERSVGIAGSAQLWFAIECTTDAQGKVVCEAVLRGRHLNWHADHGESGPGAMQEIRVSQAETQVGGRKRAIAAHGPHCDTFTVTWFTVMGRLRFTLYVIHWAFGAREFETKDAKAKKGAKHSVGGEGPR